MEKFILKGKGQELEFTPYLAGKNQICFLESSGAVSFENISLNETLGAIEFRDGSKKYLLKLDSKQLRELDAFKEEEANLFKEYFSRLKNGKEEIICYIDDDSCIVRSATAWAKGYSPYWDSMLKFFLKKAVPEVSKTDNDGEFQKILFGILQKKLSGFNVEILEEPQGDKYFKTSLEDFISILQ